MRSIVFLAAVALSTAAGAATRYVGVSPTYTAAGAPFTTSHRVSGEFLVAAPLAAGLFGADLLPVMLSFQFSDGVNTYASGDPDVRVPAFRVTTDGAGLIIGWDIFIQRWTSGSAPHSIADSHDYVSFNTSFGIGVEAATCTAIGPGDTCNSAGVGTAGVGFGTGTWTRFAVIAPVIAVPGVSGPGVALLGLLMAALALRAGRRRT